MDAIEAYCKDFANSNLNLSGESPIDTVKQIIIQKKGACRHRAWVFYILCCLYLSKHAVFIKENDLHSNNETINLSTFDRHFVDLGGHPADVKPAKKPSVTSTLRTKHHEYKRVIAHLSQELDEAMRALSQEEQDLLRDIHFDVWQLEKPEQADAKAFFDALHELRVHQQRSFLLVHQNVDAQRKAVMAHVAQMLSQGHAVYYADDPDDLSSPTPFSVDDKGNVTKNNSKESRLSQFFAACKKIGKEPTIIINVTNPDKRAEWASVLNAMLDTSQCAGDTKLPDNVTVITHAHQGNPLGMAVHSRHDKRYAPHYSYQAPKDSFTKIPLDENIEAKSSGTIELYNDADAWSSILQGDFSYNEKFNKMSYVPGLLQKLADNKSVETVVLKNAPWHDLRFQAFIQQVNKQRWFIDARGKKIDVPNHIVFKQTSGYTASQKLPTMVQDFKKQDALVLNASNLHLFCDGYGVDNNNKPPRKPGFRLLATQNPDWMQGGRYMSPAIRRRLSLITIPLYSNHSMRDILIKKGIKEPMADAITKKFMLSRAKGAQLRKYLLPTPRHVVKAADKLIQNLARKQDSITLVALRKEASLSRLRSKNV